MPPVYLGYAYLLLSIKCYFTHIIFFKWMFSRENIPVMETMNYPVHNLSATGCTSAVCPVRRKKKQCIMWCNVSNLRVPSFAMKGISLMLYETPSLVGM